MRSELVKTVCGNAASMVVGSVEFVADKAIEAITAVVQHELLLMLLTIVGIVVLLQAR